MDKKLSRKTLWPSDIVEENVVLENLKARQDMRLVFVDLTHSSCEYENGEEVKGYHLVYEPDPSHASSFRMVLERTIILRMYQFYITTSVH